MPGTHTPLLQADKALKKSSGVSDANGGGRGGAAFSPKVNAKLARLAKGLR